MNKKITFKDLKMRRARWPSKAQGLVEFALILPVILITLFVLVELARVLHAWMVIENGARAGVRYAVTAEYNPDNCPPTGCSTKADEVTARVASIHEAAWAGSSSIVRVEEDIAQPDEKSYFNVIVCDPEKLVAPSSTFGAYTCQSGEDPGEPGEQVVVVVEFNHPLLAPLLTSIWPQLRLNAVREAKVETYRIPLAVGTPPAYFSPTPRPTNTPLPTKTPPGPYPDPSCSMVNVGFKGDASAGWIRAEVTGYPVGSPPSIVYAMGVSRVRVSQDNDFPAMKITKFEMLTWDSGGTSYLRTDPYNEPASHYEDYHPGDPFNVMYCHPGGCSDVHYRGRLTVYFDRSITHTTNIGVTVSFPNDGIVCDTEWWAYYPPGIPRDTSEPYETNTPDPNPPTATNTSEPWIPPATDTPISGGPDD